MNAPLQIIINHPDQVPAVYEPFRAQLADIKSANASMIFDPADKKQNKEARSHIAKLRSSKAAVDKLRIEKKAPILEAGRRLDADAKEIIAEFDAMIDQHQKPLDEFEAADRKRVAAIRHRIDVIQRMTECRNHGSEQIAADIQMLEDMAIDDSFAEFRAEAMNMREVALGAQRSELPIAEQREADEAELARLKQELADQQTAAKTKADEEAKEKMAAAEREANLKRAAEKAEVDKKAAEKREADAKADAEKKVAAAVEAERKRVADEAAAKVAAQAKATADAEHRKSVKEAVFDAITPYVEFEDAVLLFAALERGDIPHVTLTY